MAWRVIHRLFHDQQGDVGVTLEVWSAVSIPWWALDIGFAEPTRCEPSGKLRKLELTDRGASGGAASSQLMDVDAGGDDLGGGRGVVGNGHTAGRVQELEHGGLKQSCLAC